MAEGNKKYWILDYALQPDHMPTFFGISDRKDDVLTNAYGLTNSIEYEKEPFPVRVSEYDVAIADLKRALLAWAKKNDKLLNPEYLRNYIKELPEYEKWRYVKESPASAEEAVDKFTGHYIHSFYIVDPTKDRYNQYRIAAAKWIKQNYTPVKVETDYKTAVMWGPESVRRKSHIKCSPDIIENSTWDYENGEPKKNGCKKYYVASMLRKIPVTSIDAATPGITMDSKVISEDELRPYAKQKDTISRWNRKWGRDPNFAMDFGYVIWSGPIGPSAKDVVNNYRCCGYSYTAGQTWQNPDEIYKHYTKQIESRQKNSNGK